MKLNIFSVIKYFVGAFYVLIGVTLIVNPRPLEHLLAADHIKVLGGLLILYGFFRLYRTFRLEKQKK